MTPSPYVTPGIKRFKNPSINAIQVEVVNYYGLPSVPHMLQKTRNKDICHPRQVAMYLSKQMTSQTVHRIGLEFRLDHSTVIYAEKLISAELELYPALAQEVNAIKNAIISKHSVDNEEQ